MSKEPDFDNDFWPLYPKGTRNGHGSLQGSRKEAKKAWAKLKPDDRAMAMKAICFIKKHAYLPHASRWLNGGFYETVLENRTISTKATERRCFHCQATDVVSQTENKPWVCWRAECKTEYAKL